MSAILYKDKVYGAGGGGGGGGATTLADLTDVAVSSPTDGQVLTYDDENDKWVNEDASGGDEAIILTMAEYNALTPEQQTDPTKTYYVSDAPSSGGGVNYSTQEQVIGTWIDGKPIYQITVELSTAISISANSWANTTISRTGIDNIIDVKAYKKNTNFFGNVMGAIDTSYNYLRIGNARNSAISIDGYTFQYTKTTDTAS